VHPDKLVTNAGAQIGDRLILTKPLGTGIISTALKAGETDAATMARVSRYMATLNEKASALMAGVGVHACTDITGFGLIGHACQMALSSGITLKIDIGTVPLFPEVVALARMGFCPGGLYRNRDYYSVRVDFAEGVEDYKKDILFDPQTSGGLLIAIGQAQAQQLLEKLHRSGMPEAAIIGEVVSGTPGRITLT